MSEPERKMRAVLEADGYTVVATFYRGGEWQEFGGAIGVKEQASTRPEWAFVSWDRDGTCESCYGDYEPMPPQTGARCDVERRMSDLKRDAEP